MNHELNKRVWALIGETARVVFDPTGFKNMIHSRDGDTLCAIEALFVNNKEQSGFTTLFQAERLDLTLEAFILHSEFSDLFSEQAKTRAIARLGTCDPKKSWGTPA